MSIARQARLISASERSFTAVLNSLDRETEAQRLCRINAQIIREQEGRNARS